MSTNSREVEILGAVGAMVLLIGTATGNAYAMLGLSVTAIFLLTVFYQRQMGSGPVLVALVATITAFVIGIVVAIR